MSFDELTRGFLAGCLTCKRRRNICDERRPACKQCTEGNLHCMGYQDILLDGEQGEDLIEVPQLTGPLVSNGRVIAGRETHESGERQGPVSRAQAEGRAPTIPLRPTVVSGLHAFVISQSIQLAGRTIFGPARISIQDTVVHEAGRSRLKFWSWFIGAKILQAFFNGYEEDCGALIERFHGQIRSTPSLNESDPDELALRLSCSEDLVLYTSMIANSQAAYRLLQHTVPIFVKLTSKYPRLWSPTGTILITQALYNSPHYYISKFVFYDVMAALALARPPLIQYEIQPSSSPPAQDRALEWVYGCPIPMVIVIAKINTRRTGAGVGRWSEDWRELEGEIMNWTAEVDHVDHSMDRVMRLAVQESWRHAVLIYLYMGMCGVDSRDSRVEAAVGQVVRLVGTIPTGDLLENHLFVPCLITGVAARQEPHRQIIRRKLAVSKNENVWCLRGADFVPVLDRLWHGAGRDGQGVGWNEYTGLPEVEQDRGLVD